MADAPAGGGNKLAGVEIILLVVLGLGALAVLSGNPIKPLQNSTANHVPITKAGEQCGFVISHIEPIQGVQQSVTIAGSVRSCNPDLSIFQSTVAYTTDSNSNGGSSTAIALKPINSTTGSFSVTIPVVVPPGTTVYITFLTTGQTAANGLSLTYRVPVTFQ